MVLYPTSTALETPFFKFSMIKDLSQKSINFLRYFAIGLQEFDVKIDGVFLFSVAEFFANVSGSTSRLSPLNVY